MTYIKSSDVSSTIEAIRKSATSPDTGTYVENVDDVGNAARNSYEICDEFYEFLVSLDSWSGIANGKFEKTAKEYMIKIEND